MSNYSRQREIILDAFKSIYHPTAEQIYEAVHHENPTISRSTIYRNLSVLLNDKIIKKIGIPAGPDRYDYIGDEHYHVICNICGKVFDFKYKFEKEDMSKMIQKQTKVHPNVDSMVLYGICEECERKMDYKEE